MALVTDRLAAWGYLLAGSGYLAYSAYLLGRRLLLKEARLRRLLPLVLVVSGLWGIAGLLLVIKGQPELLTLERIFDSLRYAGWYACLLILLATPLAGQKLSPRLRWLSSIAAFITVFGLVMNILDALHQDNDFFRPDRLLLFNQLTMSIFALSLVEQLLRNTPADDYWNVKPMGLGLAALFTFDLYYFSNTLLFNQVDVSLFSIRGYAHLLILPLLAQALQRAARRRTPLAFSQAAVFHTTALVVTGSYLLLTAAVGFYIRDFGGSWGTALQTLLLFAALLGLAVLMFSGTLRSRLRVLVGKHFFRYRYDYREEWLKFTRALSLAGAPEEIGSRLIRGLADLVESPAGTLWLLDRHGSYSQSARWNFPEISATEPAHGALADFLQHSGWIVNLEEYRSHPEHYENVIFPDWLASLSQAWLVIPLANGEQLVGFVILATARARLEVNWEVNDLLKTAGRQAAGFIAQLQATEALLEARKFEAFNRMSAFVVHDLKNIITQLSLMVRNAERHIDNPEFQHDMLSTVQHSVERMRQLMLQLREGAAPPGGMVGVDLPILLERIRDSRQHMQPVLSLDIQEKLVARGHEERLERVIGHMVQNALDATPASGSVSLHLYRSQGMACVEVRDTGCGMTAEFIRDRLFKPFQSTKSGEAAGMGGMGVGAFESYQYVQELGGRLNVDSTPGQGTCIRMQLPLFELTARSELHHLETA